MRKIKSRYIIGIDEVGRGPLAGAVTVGAVAAALDSKSEYRNLRHCFIHKTRSAHVVKQIQKFKILKNIKDSKKLSASQREEWNDILKQSFECHVSSVSAKVIDKIGIGRAVALAIKRVLKKFNKKPDLVLLDGSLFAPKEYKQKTIIKGDEKEPVIAAASIIAKVARDRMMYSLHKKFPKYCFDRHKGYGTKLHYRMIKKNGLSKMHRQSFCKKI